MHSFGYDVYITQVDYEHYLKIKFKKKSTRRQITIFLNEVDSGNIDNTMTIFLIFIKAKIIAFFRL